MAQPGSTTVTAVTTQIPCLLRPSFGGVAPGSWAELFSNYAGGLKRVLAMCAPQAILDMPAADVSHGSDLDVDGARLAQGVRAAYVSSRHAHHIATCVLLLAVEFCEQLQPPYVPPGTTSKALPSILVFSTAGDGNWHPYQRSRESVRRINGCGLQGECLLLDLEGLWPSGPPAKKKDGASPGPWSSLTLLWPDPPKIETKADEVWSERYLSASMPSPTVPRCLASFIDEVVRFQPAAGRSGKLEKPPPGFPPSLVLHYVALKKRRPLMRKRLRAAGIEFSSLFVQMDPDFVNDTMRQCLGPMRRQSIDSMSDNPGWRYPTRGEDSLALKHLAAAIWLVRSGEPHALVLEDDVWFSQHFAAEVAALLREAAVADWDVIAVGTCYHHRTPFGERVLPHLWLTQIMPCAHAYLLSQKGARAVLATLPLQMPIDLQINLIAQDSKESSLLRVGQWPPEQGAGLILWAEPQLAFQWPEDATRSVERT